MNKIHKLAYKEVIKLLREDPKGWEFRQYAAEHRGMKVEVWMGNRYYATRFSYGSIRVGDDINIMWFIKPWQWWRVKLVSEVEKA